MSVAAAVRPAVEIVESVTYSCPIRGCDWKLHIPHVANAKPHTFVDGLAALEVLSHIVGRYGAEGRTPHTVEEVAELDVHQLVDAAFAH